MRRVYLADGDDAGGDPGTSGTSADEVFDGEISGGSHSGSEDCGGSSSRSVFQASGGSGGEDGEEPEMRRQGFSRTAALKGPKVFLAEMDLRSCSDQYAQQAAKAA